MKKLRYKNYYFTPSWRFVALFAFIIGVVSHSIWIYEKQINRTIRVRIPPVVDFSNLSDEEIIQYRADYFMSSSDVRDRNIPFYNYHARTLQMWVNAEGRVFINGDEFGSTKNTTELIEKLKQVFYDRTYHRMFAENSCEIDKKVVIVTTHSLKYGEIIKVIDAVKASGADPVVLDVKPLIKDYKVGSN